MYSLMSIEWPFFHKIGQLFSMKFILDFAIFLIFIAKELCLIIDLDIKDVSLNDLYTYVCLTTCLNNRKAFLQ